MVYLQLNTKKAQRKYFQTLTFEVYYNFIESANKHKDYCTWYICFQIL